MITIPFKLMQQRRELSNSMPSFTMRDDPRLDRLSQMDARIDGMLKTFGVSIADAWAEYDRRSSSGA